MGHMKCGCKLQAGHPVLIEDMDRHWGHTMECLLYWELIVGPDSDPELREKVSTARLAIGKFVETRKNAVHPIAAAMGLV